MEAEAAKPKQEITDEEFMNESKPLGIAQIIYHENKVSASPAAFSYVKLSQTGCHFHSHSAPAWCSLAVNNFKCRKL